MEFTYRLEGNVDVKLRQIRSAAAKKGVNFQGDTRQGWFTGLINGSYWMDRQNIRVTITSKPFFLTWAQVDSQLRSFLEN